MYVELSVISTNTKHWADTLGQTQNDSKKLSPTFKVKKNLESDPSTSQCIPCWNQAFFFYRFLTPTPGPGSDPGFLHERVHCIFFNPHHLLVLHGISKKKTRVLLSAGVSCRDLLWGPPHPVDGGQAGIIPVNVFQQPGDALEQEIS